MIFRENTEDIYAGIEWQAGSAEAKKVIELSARRDGRARRSAFRRRARSASSRSREEGSKRLIRAAIDYAIDTQAAERDARAQGQHHEVHRGRFRDWGYELAKREYGATELDGGRGCKLPGGVVIKDVHRRRVPAADSHAAAEYGVIATLNLNGDYISDALAAQVGGIGIAPGANINYLTGHAMFEATHGTAPKYAGSGQGEPRLRDPVGRDDVPSPRLARGGGRNLSSLEKTIGQKRVTYDFERQMKGADTAQDERVREGDDREHVAGARVVSAATM